MDQLKGHTAERRNSWQLRELAVQGPVVLGIRSVGFGLEERGVESESARRSSSKGRERAIVSQTNTGPVSQATLRKLLRDGVERIWVFPERIDTILN